MTRRHGQEEQRRPAESRSARTESTEQWHALEVAEVESLLETGPNGLTPDDAAARLQRYGPNQLEEVPPPSLLELFLHQFKSPLIYILLAATVVTLLLREFIDAGVIAAVLGLNAIIGLVQERRAENSVRALMRLTSPRARVLRDGQEREIESRDVVPGDVVMLESGGRVAADLRLAATTKLAIDESLLTGESTPTYKSAKRLNLPDVPAADRVNMAFMGSVVTSGRGRGYVVATGGSTVLGAIAQQVRTEERTDTPVQQRMAHFAHVIGIAVGIASAAAFGIGILMGQTATDMFMAAVALAVASIPEGLPVVFTITLALGVRRMSRRNAIIRRLPAVETLGSTTVIGSDKTGTLTENRMTVKEVWAAGRSFPIEQRGDSRAPEGDAADFEPLRLTLLPPC